MRRLLLILSALAFVLVAACGTTDTVVAGPALEAAGQRTEPATTTVQDLVDEAVVSSPGITRYQWVVSYVFVDEDTGEVVDWPDGVSYSVDRAESTALATSDLSTLPAHVDTSGQGLVEIAFVDGLVLSRGVTFAPFTRDGSGFDRDTWYFRDLDGEGLPDLLPPDGTASALLEGIGLERAAIGTSVDFSAEDIVRLASRGDNFWAALVAADAYGGSDVAIQVHEVDGRVGSIVLLPADDELRSMEMVFRYDTPPFEVPDPAIGVDPPSPFQLVEASRPWTTETVPDHRGAILHLTVGTDPAEIMLTRHAQLITATRTDRFAGPEDFSFWQLTDEGADALLQRIRENPLVTTGGPEIGNDFDLVLEVGEPPTELVAGPAHGEATPAAHHAIEQIVLDLSFPEALDPDQVISGPEPWVPDRLTVEVRPAEVTGAGPWPLDWPVEVLLHRGPLGASILCLEARSAAAFWTLLGGGADMTELPIDDGTATYVASVKPPWPGHRPESDPCDESAVFIPLDDQPAEAPGG